MTAPAYHSIARDIGRRPRRLPCFTPGSMLAALAFGSLLGMFATVLYLRATAPREPVQPISCLLRADPWAEFQRVGFEPLRGLCTVGGTR
jgi:hypothetical protein